MPDNRMISCMCSSCKNIFKKNILSTSTTCYKCRKEKHLNSSKEFNKKKSKTTKKINRKKCIKCKQRLIGRQELFCSVACRLKVYSHVYGG